MTDAQTDPKKRSFLTIATGTMIAGGIGAVGWPLLRQMSPSKNIESPIEVDYSGLKEGESILLKLREKPVIVRRRTAKEIKQTRSVDVESLRDKFARNASLLEAASATVENRSFGPDGRYVVMFPICTHLGCIVKEENHDFQKGRFEAGFFCGCHAATFDSLGRVYGGPAPTNLPIPKFTLKNNNILVLGTDVDLS
jgi:ubiquinol-cytochrome c reductase iron-sulfur subunit